jgi:hypothetical protein
LGDALQSCCRDHFGEQSQLVLALAQLSVRALDLGRPLGDPRLEFVAGLSQGRFGPPLGGARTARDGGTDHEGPEIGFGRGTYREGAKGRDEVVVDAKRRRHDREQAGGHSADPGAYDHGPEEEEKERVGE